MANQKIVATILSVALALPGGATPRTTGTGTVKGVISIGGRGLPGLAVNLVNIETLRSIPVRSNVDGAFSVAVPAGVYLFASPGRSGVAIARAPMSVAVVAGQVASANLELAIMAFQDSAARAGTATITHDAANCLEEGQFTLIEARFEPLASVVTGRLYFQSNLSPEWFYTEFERIEGQSAGGPTHRAFIPKVNKDGGIETIRYYLQVTSTDFAETRSPEHVVKVVEDESECVGAMAPIGTPAGAVSVLSATGGAAGALTGFGGVAGATLGALAIAGIAAGVIVGGVVVQQVVTQDPTPTPTPAPTVAPTPVPTPTPTATPAALCSLTVVTSPDVAADPSVGGRFCTATVISSVGGSLGTVSGTRTFTGIPCSARVEIVASAAAQSSIAGPLPATFSNACSGSALGVPCVLNPIASDRFVGLTCQTR